MHYDAFDHLSRKKVVSIGLDYIYPTLCNLSHLVHIFEKVICMC